MSFLSAQDLGVHPSLCEVCFHSIWDVTTLAVPFMFTWAFRHKQQRVCLGLTSQCCWRGVCCHAQEVVKAQFGFNSSGLRCLLEVAKVFFKASNLFFEIKYTGYKEAQDYGPVLILYLHSEYKYTHNFKHTKIHIMLKDWLISFRIFTDLKKSKSQYTK
jgi:hypothetical protein